MKKLVLVPLFLLTPFLLLAMTPAEFALTCSAEEMQEAIAEGLDPNINLDYSSINTGLNGRAFSINGIPISVYASGNPDTGVLETLIANGADVSEKSEVLKKALMLDYATLDSVRILLPYCNPTEILPDAASYSTNTAVVEYIASQVGSLNYRRGGGSYYLARAVQNGNVANAKLLISMGADIHETTLSDGSTPTRNLLMLAAESGSVEMCEYILSLGFDVNAELNNRTALSYASNTEVAQLLLDAGATEFTSNSQRLIFEASQPELTAFYVNLMASNGEIPEFVYDYIDHYLNMSLQHPAVFRFLANLDEPKRDNILKHIASSLVTNRLNHSTIMSHIILLVACGYDFDTVLDAEGNSILHLAVINDDLFSYIPFLLDAGADPNKQNNKGITPFILLLYSMLEDYYSTLDLYERLPILIEMLDSGCDFDSVLESFSEEYIEPIKSEVETFIHYLSQARNQI